MSYEENPVLKETVTGDNVLKEWLVGYVGEKLNRVPRVYPRTRRRKLFQRLRASINGLNPNERVRGLPTRTNNSRRRGRRR